MTQEHAAKDIDDAQAIGIDGFALNIGDATRDYVSDALAYLFARAEAVGFKLYISMDVYASGDACYNGAKSVSLLTIPSSCLQTQANTLTPVQRTQGLQVDLGWLQRQLCLLQG